MNTAAASFHLCFLLFFFGMEMHVGRVGAGHFDILELAFLAYKTLLPRDYSYKKESALREQILPFASSPLSGSISHW